MVIRLAFEGLEIHELFSTQTLAKISQVVGNMVGQGKVCIYGTHISYTFLGGYISSIFCSF